MRKNTEDIREHVIIRSEEWWGERRRTLEKNIKILKEAKREKIKRKKKRDMRKIGENWKEEKKRKTFSDRRKRENNQRRRQENKKSERMNNG